MGEGVEVCLLVYWRLLADGYLNSENFYMYNPVHPFVP